MPTAWQNIDLGTGLVKESYKTDGNLVQLLESRCKFATELKLNGWSRLSSKCFDKVPELCPRLVSIGLSGVRNLSQENLKHLVENCQQLTQLDLSNIVIVSICYV